MKEENKTAIKNFLKWCKGRYGLDDETGELYEAEYGENWDFDVVIREYDEECKNL